MSSSVLDDSCISGFRGITRICLGATGLTSRKATACRSKTDSLVSSNKKQGSETPILSNKFEKTYRKFKNYIDQRENSHIHNGYRSTHSTSKKNKYPICMMVSFSYYNQNSFRFSFHI